MNGTPNPDKLKPLSLHAIGVLRSIASAGKVRRQDYNPGVWLRLEREDLVASSEPIAVKDPKRQNNSYTYVTWMTITAAGRAKLQELDK